MYRDAALTPHAASAEQGVSPCVASTQPVACVNTQTTRTIEDIMVEKQGEQIVQTAREARQAERGPSVRNVLIISTGAVIVAFAVIYFLFFMA